MPSAACPLCSSTPADLVDHLRRELRFPALECLLCPVTFFSLADADGHFGPGPLASHPAQRVQVVQIRDAEKEKRLLDLVEQAQRGIETSENETSEKQQGSNHRLASASEPEKPETKKIRIRTDESPSLKTESSTEALPHEVEPSSPSRSFETKELSQSIDPPKQESASEESNTEEWSEITLSSAVDLLSSADQAEQRNTFDKELAPEVKYQIDENRTGHIQSPPVMTVHDATRSSLGSSDAFLDQSQLGTLTELPEEVKGFLVEVEDSKPKPRKPRSQAGSKVDCMICSRSVGKNYRLDHVSTKHLCVSLWACRHCSYRNQHWVDTIGLKEHVSRKHQLPLTFEFMQNFEDLRPNHKKDFKSQLERAFPDHRFRSLYLSAAKPGKSLADSEGMQSCEESVTNDASSEEKSTADASTEVKPLLANQLLCKLCQVPVSGSETRNHVMLKHIKSVGFRCSLCNFEVPYWMSEFKQMNRHVETEHREAGPWQDVFEDLRKPHYPALKDFLRQCFDIQARCEAKEVYRLKAKPKQNGPEPKQRRQKTLLSPKKETREDHRKDGKIPIRCRCGKQLTPGDRPITNDEAREAHIWTDHGTFADRHSHRCRICRRGLKLAYSQGHIESVHKLPCSNHFRRRCIEDIRTDEEKAEVTGLLEANYALDGCRSAAHLADRSYETLSFAEKHSVYRERNQQGIQPITEAEILRIQVAEQRWLACLNCPAFVAASDVERHILADHRKAALVRCSHCAHAYTATRHWQCLDRIKDHLWTKHSLAVDVRAVQSREALRAHIRKDGTIRDADFLNLVRLYFGKGAEALGGFEQRAKGLVPLLSAKTWPADVPQPQRLPPPETV